MEWTCREQRFDFSNGPLLMGILNVTPDSFSDGGRFDTTAAALQQATQMLADGADIIDIGGESTRPGAVAVDAATECQRVIPVIQAIRATHPAATLSIDTSKAAVADAALIAGAAIINDVTAMEEDSAMPAVACAHAAGVVLMHMQGDPRSMQQAPRYEDAVRDVASYLAGRAAALEAAGLPAAHIALDPGIGFGKSVDHNLALIAGLAHLTKLGYPVLIGLSRKRFLGRLTSQGVDDRLAASLAGLSCAIMRGARIVRVHDVAASRDALNVAYAIASAAA
jgi:dihydropteroate synthase